MDSIPHSSFGGPFATYIAPISHKAFLHYLIICKKVILKTTFKVTKIRFFKLSKEVPILSFWRVTLWWQDCVASHSSDYRLCIAQHNLSIHILRNVRDLTTFCEICRSLYCFCFAEYMLGTVKRTIYIFEFLEPAPHWAPGSKRCRVEFEALCFLLITLFAKTILLGGSNLKLQKNLIPPIYTIPSKIYGLVSLVFVWKPLCKL